MLSWGPTSGARKGLRASPNTPGKLSGSGSLALALKPRNTSATPASPGLFQIPLLGLSFPLRGCPSLHGGTRQDHGLHRDSSSRPIRWGRWWEAGRPHGTQTPAWAERLERPTAHSTHAGWLVGSKRTRGAPGGYRMGEVLAALGRHGQGNSRMPSSARAGLIPLEVQPSTTWGPQFSHIPTMIPSQAHVVSAPTLRPL